MSGRLALFLFLLLPALLCAEDKNKPEEEERRSKLPDQPRFSCLISELRKVPAECADNQLVCYYTRRIPRFQSDFRPNDMVGRGCDVPRNKDKDSCQEFTKGLDTFVRCECGTSDCNTHFWHGFATAALHHRKLLREAKEREKDARTFFDGFKNDGPAKYSDWFMTCFQLYLLLWCYYFGVNCVKKFQFQKRAVMMRAVLVARGTQQADEVQWGFEHADDSTKPSTDTTVTIHNYKTSLVKIMDGFIRYRSLGSLPPVDIQQLRATWLLPRQDLHRCPAWFRRLREHDKTEKQATVYDQEFLDAARIGIERFFVNETITDEMTIVAREKKNARPRIVQMGPTTMETTKANEIKSDPADESSARNTAPAPPNYRNPHFSM